MSHRSIDRRQGRGARVLVCAVVHTHTQHTHTVVGSLEVGGEVVQQGTERNPQPTALPSVLHSAWPWPSSFLLTERAARNSDNTAPGAKKRSFTHSPREVVCGSREQQGARNRGGGTLWSDERRAEHAVDADDAGGLKDSDVVGLHRNCCNWVSRVKNECSVELQAFIPQRQQPRGLVRHAKKKVC